MIDILFMLNRMWTIAEDNKLNFVIKPAGETYKDFMCISIGDVSHLISSFSEFQLYDALILFESKLGSGKRHG